MKIPFLVKFMPLLMMIMLGLNCGSIRKDNCDYIGMAKEALLYVKSKDEKKLRSLFADREFEETGIDWELLIKAADNLVLSSNPIDDLKVTVDYYKNNPAYATTVTFYLTQELSKVEVVRVSFPSSPSSFKCGISDVRYVPRRVDKIEGDPKSIFR